MADNIIIFCVGIVFILGGVAAIIFQMKKKSEKARCIVDATVIAIKEKSSMSEHQNNISKKGILYFPVYEFYVDGIQYHVTDSAGTSYKKYQVGEKETIVYDKKNPQKISSKLSADSNYTSIFIIILIGILFIIMAIID